MRNAHVRTGQGGGHGKRHEPCLLVNSGMEGSNVDEFLRLIEPISVSSSFTVTVPSGASTSTVGVITDGGFPDIYEHTLSTS